MRQLYIFLSLMFFVAGVRSQTLTATDCNPVAGDVFKKKFVPGLVDPSDGQNKLWDISKVTFMYNDVYIDSIVGSGSVLQPNSFKRKTSGSPWLTETFRATSDTLYSNIQGYLLYPLYYGRSWTSADTYTAITSGSIEAVDVIFTGSVTGSGTLMTIGGTFPNTLKVKLSTVYSHSLNGNYYATRTWQYSNWYTYGYHDPIMSSRMVLSTLNEDFFYYTYFNLEPPNYTSVEEVKIRDLTLYPIPSDKTLNIQLGSSFAKISLFDLTGKCIFEQNTVSGDLQIKTAELESGIYLLRMISGDKMLSRKIVISH